MGVTASNSKPARQAKTLTTVPPRKRQCPQLAQGYVLPGGPAANIRSLELGRNLRLAAIGDIALDLRAPCCFFFEGGAADLREEHAGGEVGDAMRGFYWRDAAGVDVGDEVAVGVGVAGAGFVGHVSGEAFGGGEAGALADQEDQDTGGEQVADVVHDAYAAVADSEGLTDGPGVGAGMLVQKRKQGWDLSAYGGYREAVADYDLDVGGFGAALVDFAGGGVA